MSIDTRKELYEQVLVGWEIGDELGNRDEHKNAVFSITRTGRVNELCALKVIQLISANSDEANPDDEKYKNDLEKCKNEALKEVQFLINLRDTNVVYHLDHAVVPWREGKSFGCDLLIRMEFLSDLRSEEKNGIYFDENAIIKIGTDICKALVLCHDNNVLHRDIKPANIFYTKGKNHTVDFANVNYKLGDFGISKLLDDGDCAMTRTGTPVYATPEQWNGWEYNKQADIYCLGLTLYELANENRLPLVDESFPTKNSLNKIARYKRTPMEFPPPKNASPALAKIILKACEFSPEDRYQTAQEMLDDLNKLGSTGGTTSSANIKSEENIDENHKSKWEDYACFDEEFDSLPFPSPEQGDVNQQDVFEQFAEVYEHYCENERLKRIIKESYRHSTDESTDIDDDIDDDFDDLIVDIATYVCCAVLIVGVWAGTAMWLKHYALWKIAAVSVSFGVLLGCGFNLCVNYKENKLFDGLLKDILTFGSCLPTLTAVVIAVGELLAGIVEWCIRIFT